MIGHFISVSQLTPIEIFSVFKQATTYKKTNIPLNKQLFVANLFFEPSTRTKMSFIVAQKKLGLEVLDFHNSSSSVMKGESLYDTVKTFESIGADLAVIRHRSDHWFDQLLPYINIPIINAGAGEVEHPTQCLLDLYTIYQEFGSFSDLNIVISGDVKHSRVAHSNAYALQRLGANVYISAAKQYMDDSLDFPYISMNEAVEICDVLMLLRVQSERHVNGEQPINNYLKKYGLTVEREQRMKDEAIILHPAPINREVEIDSELVECDRSRIFKQMENGVYIRMALMNNLLNKRGI